METNPEMLTMLKDVDVYLTVPLKLFELPINPYYSDNAGEIDTILQLIEAEEMTTYELFSDHCKVIDWSQFKPRGHYAEDPNTCPPTDLPKYFRAMMWLGRTELYLTKPKSDTLLCPPPSFTDVETTDNRFLSD